MLFSSNEFSKTTAAFLEDNPDIADYKADIAIAIGELEETRQDLTHAELLEEAGKIVRRLHNEQDSNRGSDAREADEVY